MGAAYYGQQPPATLPPPAGRFTAAPWILLTGAIPLPPRGSYP